MSALRTPAPTYEVVACWGRGGAVAWEVWADREPTPYGWRGDLINTLDSEDEAHAIALKLTTFAAESAQAPRSAS